MIGVVRVGEARNDHTESVVGGVDESTRTNINAVVRKPGLVGSGEEHNVTWLKIRPRHSASTLELTPHVARNRKPALAPHVPDATRAIDARMRRTGPRIRRPEDAR